VEARRPNPSGSPGGDRRQDFVNPTYRPRTSRGTVFEAVLESRAAHLRRRIESARQTLAPHRELEVLHHVLTVLEELDDRTRPRGNLGR
jgi:hypothetical protein